MAVKHIPQKGGKAKEWVRFLSGVTPEGVVFYGNSIAKNYEQCIIVKDEYGVVSDAVMRGVRDRALKEGYEIITVKNAFLPNKLIDHILIPELSLVAVLENGTIVAQNNSQYVGGIAGYLSETAKISDSYVQGFQCTNSTTTMYLGGLVGYITAVSRTLPVLSTTASLQP